MPLPVSSIVHADGICRLGSLGGEMGCWGCSMGCSLYVVVVVGSGVQKDVGLLEGGLRVTRCFWGLVAWPWLIVYRGSQRWDGWGMLLSFSWWMVFQ
jgi:hypothetical protein